MAIGRVGFEYNGFRLRIQTGLKPVERDVYGCRKEWIDLRGRIVFRVGGTGWGSGVSGYLDVSNIGKVLDVIIDKPEKALYINCGEVRYLLGAPGFKP